MHKLIKLSKLNFMTSVLLCKSKCIKPLLFFGLIFLFCAATNAQTDISGMVSDQNGPLPGVSVLVEGTTNGVATDFDGRYQLNNVAANATLVSSKNNLFQMKC